MNCHVVYIVQSLIYTPGPRLGTKSWPKCPNDNKKCVQVLIKGSSNLINMDCPSEKSMHEIQSRTTIILCMQKKHKDAPWHHNKEEKEYIRTVSSNQRLYHTSSVTARTSQVLQAPAIISSSSFEKTFPVGL